MKKAEFILRDCPVCGMAVPAANHCVCCGTYLGGNTTKELPTVKCPHCEKKVAIGSFCGNCGKRLDEHK